MRVDVHFTPAELAGLDLTGRVVVIDVLRATSTIVEAMANGARAVFPVATADEAARIAQNIGRDSVVLCGERKALPIEGFDLGNAPPEFSADRVRGKSLVMTTTNGTRAFLAVDERGGGRADETDGSVVAASFLNLSAVIERLASASSPVDLVCAGREGRFALEDAVCAGAIVRGLEEAGVELESGDGALAARSLAGRHMRHLRRMLELTAAGRHLERVGRGDDVAFCAQIDRTAAIPRLRDRKITLE